jgi:motility quorum-sensing regulator / GCU-specific mRNA interferase toxin
VSGATKNTYDLGAVQALIAKGAYFINASALTGAMKMGFDRSDIVACVLALDDSTFYKTMPSQSRPGTFQDVYKTTYDGQNVYLKLQMTGSAIVISFKEDESP